MLADNFLDRESWALEIAQCIEEYQGGCQDRDSPMSLSHFVPVPRVPVPRDMLPPVSQSRGTLRLACPCPAGQRVY